MLARGALCRLAAEVPKQATHDLPKLASLVQTARDGYALPIRTLPHLSQLQTRAYATTTAATKPTETVKKAVKAKAAAGKSVKKTTTAKKATPKKAAPKKAAPKKAKKKAAPKKPVKRVKKPVTPEQKEKTALARLRVLALKEPVPRRALTAFNVYLAESLKGSKGAVAQIGGDAKGFKDITPAEREHYNHLAAERNVARAAEYKAWIESHTPDQIRIANNARGQLRKRLPSLKSGARHAHTAQLIDERQVKRPTNAWVLFFSERTASPDFNGIAIAERANLISGEWKALNANEKKGYDDRAAADRQRYSREASASPSPSN